MDSYLRAIWHLVGQRDIYDQFLADADAVGQLERDGPRSRAVRHSNAFGIGHPPIRFDDQQAQLWPASLPLMDAIGDRHGDTHIPPRDGAVDVDAQVTSFA